jgi:arylsulfatase A-like enzyme
MAEKPRNIIVIVADSLRFDSVYTEAGTGLDYVEPNSIQFLEARSGGCWTLPATASIFTGLLPHEHGATAQTRGIHKDIPTLAEKMKAAGYKTYQITANVATTHIFGLDRGFDEIHRIWQQVEPKFSTLQQFLVLIAKPRLREKLLSKDMIMNRLSEDIETAKTWLQHTYLDIFNKARQIVAENEAKGESSFIFLNLMETHFPYHVAPTFRLDAPGIFKKLQELVALFHMANQTFLKKGYQNVKRPQLDQLKGRQQKAWRSIARDVDSFCQEMHENTGNLVVFGADHGENFGESGWTYHFSNVTDAGNKVPMFWLPHDGRPASRVLSPMSTRDLYSSMCEVIGEKGNGPSVLDEVERSHPIMSSYWYNNKGATHENYKYNQLAFLYGQHRFMLRNGKWYQGPAQTDMDEPGYELVPGNANPVEEMIFDLEQKAYYQKVISEFSEFSGKIKF